MNILITGSTGFIGKNLLRQLSDEGDAKVYAICRKELIGFKADNVKFIETDLSQKNWLQNVPGEIDVVVYLAQSYRYREFPDGAEDMLRINEQCVFEMLEWSRKNGVQKFIFASTGNVSPSSTATPVSARRTTALIPSPP